MAPSRTVILTLLRVLFVLVPVLSQAADAPSPSSSVPSGKDLNQGWTEQDRRQWYHASAGTQFLPYDWFVALEDEPLKNSFTRTGILPDPEHPDKLPVGFTKMEGPNVQTPLVGLTCAFCHTTQFSYRGETIRIEGGPSLQYNARFLLTLLEVLRDLKTPPEKFPKFAATVLQRSGQAVTPESMKHVGAQVTAFLQKLVQRSGRDVSPMTWGPGRFDALGRGSNLVFGSLHPDNLRPANAPVSIPALWGVWEYDWVQWSGSIQHPLARNIAQVIGVNAGLFSWAENPSHIPADDAEKFRSSVDIPTLKTLENLARRLYPPRWPKAFPPIDRETAARGRDLYHGKPEKGIPNLCAHCHVATPLKNPHPAGPRLHVTMIPQTEVGTDPLYLENFSRRSVDLRRLGLDRVVPVYKASEFLTTEIMKLGPALEGPDYGHLTNEWRDLPQYIARPHLAVWATAPFLHNGSVPNLYELLSPAEDRHSCFSLSPMMEFDPVKVGYVVTECSGSSTFRDPLGAYELRTQLPGNGNGGHEFKNTPDCGKGIKEGGVLGCELPVADRWAIIEYLKTCDFDRLVLKDSPACHDLE